jgi:2-octaprenyl-6-methoxyphenol hydroxylase
MSKAEEIDILIIGGGPVGMTLALAMQHSPCRVLLIDKRPLAAQADDPRALALSYGTRQLLENLQAWPGKAVTAIHSIHVSQRGGFGRTLIEAQDQHLPALGYVTRYRHLAATLQNVALARLTYHDAARLDDLQVSDNGVLATITHQGQRLRYQARLVVHAEGAPADGEDVEVRDYRQHAIICEAMPDRPHENRAWERFTPEGPLALLPLGEGCSVVFTVPPERADALMRLSEANFRAALARQFGNRFGFRAVGQRERFPLALRQRRQVVRGREVWIGNAAQTLHPVSGQGFNLGLRDAWQLAKHLEAANTSLGAPEASLEAALSAYAASRALDRMGGAFFTDSVVRLFSNDLLPLRFLRGLGLLGLDLLPFARHFIARRMIWGERAFF